MMNPEPSAFERCCWRGMPSWRSMKSRKKSSNGEPGGSTGRMPSSMSATVVVVVTLTTAGLSRSESSAKLSGTKRGPGSTSIGSGAVCAATGPTASMSATRGTGISERKRAVRRANAASPVSRGAGAGRSPR